jgi:polysaccharide deacetylase 2 family uncharacterized protein YibQ
MQRLRAILQKYAHMLWWGSLGILCTMSLVALVMVFVAGRSETDDAFAEGRRLVIAMDTGEVQGKRISLDKPVNLPPTPPAETKTETPPAETPVPETPAEVPPPETTSPTETPPPAAEVEKPASELQPQVTVTPTAELNTALTEEINGQRLPTIGKDGTKPWRYYSKAYDRTRNQPMVAIVVTGLGIGKTVTQEALHLPENISLSFSPYTRDVTTWAPAARATGHELLIELPLQPSNYPATDPGPNAMLLEKGTVDVEKQLQWTLSRFPAFIGALTPLNESFTANDEAIKMLLQTFANRGLLFVMSKEPYRKETRDIVDATVGTASLIANVLIDEEPSADSIQQRLTQLEEQAKKTGYAIGVAQAYPLTMEQLKLWASKLEEKGVVLVPLSAIAKLRFS